MKIQELIERKVVAVIRHATKENILQPVLALIRGGVSVIEVTVENESGYDAIKTLSTLNENFVLGAGTVLNKEMAIRAIESGAKFIVTPVLVEEVIHVAHEHNVIAIIGALSPSEVYKATSLGADMVKIFPIDSMGLNYVKTLKAPLTMIKVIGTGGINLENGANYLARGVDMIGVGSQLIDQIGRAHV